MGPDGNLRNGISGTAANDSELSNPEEVVTADKAVD